MKNLGTMKRLLKDKNLLKILGWTLKCDIIFPFPEIVLAVSIYIILRGNPISDTASSDTFTNLTSNLIYLIIIFVGISGARGYAIALERGEFSRQMIGLSISRTRIVILKWFSIFILCLLLLLAVDIAAFFSTLGYFPYVNSYTVWGSAPLLAFAVMIGEQALLLAFLNSLSSAFSLIIRKTTVSLLVFFIATLLGVQLYMVGTTGGPLEYLQLGYGDYYIVMDSVNYIYYGFINHTPISASFLQLSEQFYVGLAYRAVGAIALLGVSILSFMRADLD
jgi:hypothetical protein